MKLQNFQQRYFCKGQMVGHLELAHQFESFCAALVHGVAFLLSSSKFFRPLVRFLKDNELRIPRKVQNVLNL